jgi:phage-related protein
MNLMDLFIKIGLKDEASKPIEKIGKAVGSGLKSAVKVGTVAIGAASTAIGTLVTQSVKAYANYEQLIGGIETLFSNLEGTVSAAPQVLENAANAFKTAGMSANEYMETVTSFSAALIAGLEGDYEAAARVSDMAITDMSDNANKMGTSMESIQMAYQGFAKQNYTMLDNLKLGYGGTKTEMERLLKDAQQLTGVKYDISNLSDVYEAIHVIQTEMGITGTTAKEAASTISGSLGMLKASFKNLVTGLGRKDANLSELFKNVADSAKTAFGNLKPVIKNALTATSGLIRELAPMISEELPGLLEDILPDLISAAGDLIGGLADAIPVLLGAAVENLPGLIDAGIKIGGKLVDGIISVVHQIGEKLWTALDTALSESKFGERWESIKETATKAAEKIGEAWEELKIKAQPLIDKVQEAWQKFKDWEEENHLLEGAIGLVGDAISGVIGFAGDLLSALDSAWSGVEAGASAAAGYVLGAWGKVYSFFSGLADTISGIFGATDGGFNTHTGSFGSSGRVGKFAIGNDYVPYDNYPAMLHKGEAVLTASEAEAWRRGSSGHAVENVFNFYGVSQSDLDYIVDYVNRGLA